LDGVVYNFGGANKFGYTLTRDPAGRITQKTEIIEGDTAIYDYAYDANGRLIEVRKNGSIVETYTYDANGNRLTELNTLRGINRSYTVSAEDHLITAGTDSYQFDADGFLTGKTSGSNTSTYQYSSRGELLSATLPGSTSITYDHDPLGRRIAKRVNGAIIEKYLWKDAITLMAVYDASDNLLMRFHYADGRTPVSMSYNGSTYYLAYDQVGSLKTVSDAAGNIIKRVDYDSFGSIINDTNPSLRVSIGFAGGLHDRDTGLVRFGARDYDPALGRWTAKDPINFVGGDTNLYGYVQNDPVNWVDPFGLTEQAALIGQYVSGALARGGLGVSPSPWEIPNWLIPPYGRWGGPGRSGPGKPIDSLDKCFRTHDMDYLSAGIEDWNNIDSSKIKDRKKCDRKVSNCISELPLNPLLWESPPPWWMPIEYATLYRIGSGALFRWMGR
jgi:RHS repeat-associated protein